jgi:hypothetical protein
MGRLQGQSATAKAPCKRKQKKIMKAVNFIAAKVAKIGEVEKPPRAVNAFIHGYPGSIPGLGRYF